MCLNFNWSSAAFVLMGPSQKDAQDKVHSSGQTEIVPTGEKHNDEDRKARAPTLPRRREEQEKKRKNRSGERLARWSESNSKVATCFASLDFNRAAFFQGTLCNASTQQKFVAFHYRRRTILLQRNICCQKEKEKYSARALFFGIYLKFILFRRTT